MSTRSSVGNARKPLVLIGILFAFLVSIAVAMACRSGTETGVSMMACIAGAVSSDEIVGVLYCSSIGCVEISLDIIMDDADRDDAD